MAGLPLDCVLQKLSDIAPLRLAESWDNVGLLIGHRSATVQRVMTCLTVTPEVVDEAIERQADLLVAHHPLPFKALSRITSDSTTGLMLLNLIAAGVAVYSAHTAFDSAESGINAMWAEMLSLHKIRPLEAAAELDNDDIGAGRYGDLSVPIPLDEFATRAAQLVEAPHFRIIEADRSPSIPVASKVAVACGSGGGFVGSAKRHGCDTMVTGEATFHACLEARASGVHLVLVGHYYSERFAMERLANTLAAELAGLNVFASTRDVDPLKDAFSGKQKH